MYGGAKFYTTSSQHMATVGVMARPAAPAPDKMLQSQIAGRQTQFAMASTPFHRVQHVCSGWDCICMGQSERVCPLLGQQTNSRCRRTKSPEAALKYFGGFDEIGFQHTTASSTPHQPLYVLPSFMLSWRPPSLTTFLRRSTNDWSATE